MMSYVCFFFFKQKTAYEMRISDWSSDVCSSDLWRTVEGAEKNDAGQIPARGDHPRLHRREGNRQARGAAHGGGRLRQSPAYGHGASGRPDRDLSGDKGQAAGPPHPSVGTEGRQWL